LTRVLRIAAPGLVAALLATNACSWPISHAQALITISPTSSFEDEPIHFWIRDLAAGEQATVTITSTDASGRRWRAMTAAAAGRAGAIELDARLLWSMKPDDGARAIFEWGTTATTFNLQVTAGGRTTSRSFRRSLSPADVETTHLGLAADGFVANYVIPKGSTHLPAVLVLGGAEGGLPGAFAAPILAGRGVAVLDLAYFKAPGLPQQLNRIPLEYFAKALEWLAGRPEVDSGRLYVWGASRGSEAALLLGSNFPKLVHGVIALVPSDVALCSYPTCDGPAWTLGGRPLPFTRLFDNPFPPDDPAAVIQVERIHGGLLLDCGGRDQVWVSCTFAQAIVQRLDSAKWPYRHELYEYPDAGHGVASPVPYEPSSFPTAPDDATADEAARADLWPRILNFLRSGS
jgi:dienelactone hydrolase